MRRLVSVLVVLVLIFVSYWFAARALIGREAQTLQDGLSARGLTASLSETTVTGFPLNFLTRLSDVDFRDPVSGYGWQGGSLELEVPSYLPTSLSVRLPAEQVIRTPGGDLSVVTEELAGAVSVGLSTTAPLDKAEVTGGATVISGPLGEIARLAGIGLSLTPADAPLDYALSAEVTGLTLPGLTAPAEEISAEGMLSFDKPLDRFAAEGAPPGLTAVDLAQARLVWGGGEMIAAGALTIGNDGIPDGTIDLTVTGWEAMIEAAVAGGLIKPEVAPTWASMGTMLAEGKPQIALPLIFAGGQMRLGPLPLGPAPRLR